MLVPTAFSKAKCKRKVRTESLRKRETYLVPIGVPNCFFFFFFFSKRQNA